MQQAIANQHSEAVMEAMELMYLAGSLLKDHDASDVDRQRLGWLLSRNADRLAPVIDTLDREGGGSHG